jgi:hypothetical protein
MGLVCSGREKCLLRDYAAVFCSRRRLVRHCVNSQYFLPPLFRFECVSCFLQMIGMTVVTGFLPYLKSISILNTKRYDAR